MRNAASETVRKLRGFLGETQEEFARRMDIALITISRWETSRPPRGKALKALASLSRSKGLREYAEIFEQAMRGEITPVKRTVRMKEIVLLNETERLKVNALLRVERNQEAYADEFNVIEKALKKPIDDINDLMAEAQTNADVRQAIVRLAEEGKTDDEIAALFNLNPEHIKQMLILHRMGARLREASK